MGVLDKLKFWKKEEFEDFKLPEAPASPAAPAPEPFGADGMAPPSPASPPPSGLPDFPGHERPLPSESQQPPDQPFIPQSFQERQDFSKSPVRPDSQMDLISSKLDTIKAQLESVIQRLDRLEQGSRPYQKRWGST